MPDLNLPTFECLRCGHRWHPVKEEMPICCGFCKTPYWNKPPSAPSRARERHDAECATCKTTASA